MIEEHIYGVKVVLDLYDDLQGFSLGLENLIAKRLISNYERFRKAINSSNNPFDSNGV